MVKIQGRRDTAVNWALTNPVLAAGERGFDTTNNLFKIGNGVDTWQYLPEFNPNCLLYMGLWNPSLGSYPANPEKGWFYIAGADGITNSIQYRNGDWIVYNGTTWDKVNNYQSASGQTPDTVTYVTSALYTLDDLVNHLVQANAVDNNIEINLPTPYSGTTVKVKKTDISSHTVKIIPVALGYGSSYIDSGDNYLLEYPNEFVFLQCDGSGWYVVSE